MNTQLVTHNQKIEQGAQALNSKQESFWNSKTWTALKLGGVALGAYALLERGLPAMAEKIDAYFITEEKDFLVDMSSSTYCNPAYSHIITCPTVATATACLGVISNKFRACDPQRTVSESHLVFAELGKNSFVRNLFAGQGVVTQMVNALRG